MNRATLPFEEPSFLCARLGDAPYAVGVGSLHEAIALSHDGRLVAGALGELLWLARADDGVIVRWLDAGAYTVHSLAFSRDDARLFAVGHHRVRAFRLSDGARVLDVARAAHCARGALTPDESTLVIDAHTSQWIVDVATGAVSLERPKGPMGNLLDCIAPVVTADGRFAALSDTWLRAWELGTDAVTEVATPGPFTHACAVGAGSDIVVAGPGVALTRYDLSDRRVVASGKALGKVHGLYVEDATLWVWAESPHDLSHWNLTAYDPDTLSVLTGVVARSVPSFAALALRGDTLAFVHNGTLTVAPRRSAVLSAGERPVWGSCGQLRISPDGAHVSAAFGGSAMAARRWAVATGERVGAYQPAVHQQLWLSPDGARAYSNQRYGRHPATRAALDPTATQTVFDDVPGDVSYVPGADGRVISVGPTALRVLPDGATFPLPARHKLSYRFAWQQPDELVIAWDSKRVAAFDLRAQALIEPKSFSGLRAVCPVGGAVWAVTDKGAQLWDLRAAQKLRALAFSLPPNSMVFTAAASPDGRRLALGLAFGDVRVLELDGAGRTLTFKGVRSGWASALAFSDDGRLLATGGAEPCVRVWDIDAALAAAPAAAAPKRAKKRG